jgi:hypothetical protein
MIIKRENSVLHFKIVTRSICPVGLFDDKPWVYEACHDGAYINEVELRREYPLVFCVINLELVFREYVFWLNKTKIDPSNPGLGISLRKFDSPYSGSSCNVRYILHDCGDRY